jgi:hypothetical protein
MKKTILILSIILSAGLYVAGQNDPYSKYVKAYITLNGDSLYTGRVISLSGIDTNSSFALVFDTLFVYDPGFNYLYHGYSVMDMPGLESYAAQKSGKDSVSLSASDFYIISFRVRPVCSTLADVTFNHLVEGYGEIKPANAVYGEHLTADEIRAIRDCGDTGTVYLEEIKVGIKPYSIELTMCNVKFFFRD